MSKGCPCRITVTYRDKHVITPDPSPIATARSDASPMSFPSLRCFPPRSDVFANAPTFSPTRRRFAFKQCFGDLRNAPDFLAPPSHHFYIISTPFRMVIYIHILLHMLFTLFTCSNQLP